jgi:hypothetical protein
MTTEDHAPFTHLVESWLDSPDDFLDPDTVLDRVMEQVETRPQRRATWPEWRIPFMNKVVTIGLGAAAVVVALVVGVQLFGSPSDRVGDPADPATPTSEPRAPSDPAATPEPAVGLPEGPHLMLERQDTGDSITVTIAAPDWDGNPGEGWVVWGPTGPDGPTGAGVIGFTEGEYYVYGDPCAWASTRPDAPATTVDGLIAALANQAWREASDPEDVTVDGHAGKKIILQMTNDVPSFDECDGDFGLFGVAPEISEVPYRYSQGPGQVEEVWAVDVDGQVVVIIAVYYPDTPQHAIDEARAIIESATIELP